MQRKNARRLAWRLSHGSVERNLEMLAKQLGAREGRYHNGDEAKRAQQVSFQPLIHGYDLVDDTQSGVIEQDLPRVEK